MAFTSNEKHAIVAVLWSIMKADGVVEENEQEFLNQVYRKIGINIDDFQNISSLNVEDCKKILKQMPAEKKADVDKCFLQMVGVDGSVDLRELRVLRDLI